jgi:hypothetical protein
LCFYCENAEKVASAAVCWSDGAISCDSQIFKFYMQIFESISRRFQKMSAFIVKKNPVDEMVCFLVCWFCIYHELFLFRFRFRPQSNNTASPQATPTTVPNAVDVVAAFRSELMQGSLQKKQSIINANVASLINATSDSEGLPNVLIQH